VQKIQNRIPPCLCFRNGIACRQENAITDGRTQDCAAERAAIGALLRDRAGSGQQCQEQYDGGVQVPARPPACPAGRADGKPAPDRQLAANVVTLESRSHLDEVFIVGVRSLGSKGT
jgi:hypothetical protein